MSDNIPPEIYYREPHKIDWVCAHRDNMAVGTQGQDLVLELEKNYLLIMGKEDLSNKVCLVDDWSGYDIRSYFPDGREKFIEVKTTPKEIEAPYFLSRNELIYLAKNRDNSFLYRVSISNDNRSPRLKVYTFSEVIQAEVLPYKFTVRHTK